MLKKDKRSKSKGLACGVISATQLVSHFATFYTIGCFAALILPTWRSEADSIWAGPVFWGFWLLFLVDLALYSFVLSADTRYIEPLPGMPSSYSEGESRKCDDCGCTVSHPRVKHCQTCGWCMAGFDHHCRYLNVCVGGRTYPAWFSFVLLLLVIISTCTFGAIHALTKSSRYELSATSPELFWTLASVAAAASVLECLFLFALLGQHTYFCLAGITTLEYIKDQDPGFPAIPPHGWRDAVQNDQCPSCSMGIVLVEAADSREIWYCSICQGDLAKAGIRFWICDSCETVNVCPLCYQAARSMGTVTTYRASSLKRRCEGFAGIADELHTSSAFGNGVSRSSRGGSPLSTRLSSFSGEQREMRLGGKALGAVVAAVEGHSGEVAQPPERGFCCCSPRQDVDEDSGDESGSSDGLTEDLG